MAIDGGGPAQRGKLDVVVGLQVGLDGEMEFSVASKRFQHRQYGIDFGDHVDQLRNLDVEQVEVQSQEEVVASWCFVQCSQLHAGRIGGEAHLV